MTLTNEQLATAARAAEMSVEDARAYFATIGSVPVTKDGVHCIERETDLYTDRSGIVGHWDRYRAGEERELQNGNEACFHLGDGDYFCLRVEDCYSNKLALNKFGDPSWSMDTRNTGTGSIQPARTQAERDAITL